MVIRPQFSSLKLGKKSKSRKITHYLYGVLAETTKRAYNAGKPQIKIILWNHKWKIYTALVLSSITCGEHISGDL